MIKFLYSKVAWLLAIDQPEHNAGLQMPPHLPPVCRGYRTLKRHLGGLGLTPEQSREKWSLPRDYPMVAESYAAKRSELAKKLGLGRKAAPKVVEEPAPAPEPTAAALLELAAEAPVKSRRGRAKKAGAEPAAS